MSSPRVRLWVVPILVTSVKTMCVKTDFPVKTTSNFEQERRYVHVDKTIKKDNEISQTNGNLRRRHFPFNRK
jgi:hypothetical protein